MGADGRESVIERLGIKRGIEGFVMYKKEPSMLLIASICIW